MNWLHCTQIMPTTPWKHEGTFFPCWKSIFLFYLFFSLLIPILHMDFCPWHACNGFSFLLGKSFRILIDTLTNLIFKVFLISNVYFFLLILIWWILLGFLILILRFSHLKHPLYIHTHTYIHTQKIKYTIKIYFKN